MKPGFEAIVRAAQNLVAVNERTSPDVRHPTINEGIALAGLVYELDRAREAESPTLSAPA